MNENTEITQKPLPFKLQDIKVGASVEFACGKPPYQLKGMGTLTEAPFLDDSGDWVFTVWEKDAKIPNFLYADEITSFSNPNGR